MQQPTATDTLAVPSPIALLRAADVSHPERAVARGDLLALRRGIYVAMDAWRALPPWDRYLVRVLAVAMMYPGAVFCLESAAALRGLPVFGDPVTVHVLGDSTRTSRVQAGICVHTAAVPRELETAGGILATAPVETAVDVARHRHAALALAVADAALRLDPTLRVEMLVAANESRASSRGRRQARWALHRATAASESTLESVSAAAIEWLGFPEPERQVWFTDPQGVRDRSDFWWPAERIIGEADGDSKYDGRFGDPIAALRERRARDARLRRSARSVVHWAWPEVVASAELRSILTGAGLRRIAAEDTAQLASMQRLLTPRSAPFSAPAPAFAPAGPARLLLAAETAG